MKNKARVLFICKLRSRYGASYGLLNSCRFLCNALRSMGFEADVVEVIDNNDIDREVAKYKPTHVFIEALWVVPEKFMELTRLHPKVKWYVRIHSNAPFLAHEGSAMKWCNGYQAVSMLRKNFKLSANCEEFIDEAQGSMMGMEVVYAPNIYQPTDEPGIGHYHRVKNPDKHIVHIGCFGAIRPLKNQLLQAMAAMQFAYDKKKELHFHMNGNRVEQSGEPILKNIRELFKPSGHKLIEHDWMTHNDFMKLVCTMDIGMQVSLSETFDIIAADFVAAGVPLVGSKEIRWLAAAYQCDATVMKNIVSHLHKAYDCDWINYESLNKHGLIEWNEDASKVWKRLLKSDHD